MKVTLSKYHSLGDQSYGVDDYVRCTLGDGDATVEIRQSKDGKCMIVIIEDAHVSMEPRSAAIWLVVKEKP